METKIRKIIVIRALQNMVRALSEKQVIVYCYGIENQSEMYPEGNIRVFLKDKVNFEWISSLYKLISEEKPEVIHVNSLKDLFVIFIIVRFCVKHKPRPIIVAMSHNPSIWKKNRLFVLIFSKYIQLLSDGYISLTNKHRDQMLRYGFPLERIAVIPNPFDPNYIEQNNSLRKDKEKIDILYLANICERKAQYELIRAFYYVSSKYSNTVLHLVGKVLPNQRVYFYRLNELIKNLSLENKVLFHGALPYSEAQRMLRECDIFVFPTKSEMMPRALIEAMLAKKPVVASGVDGILDLIENNVNGLLIEPGDIQQLQEKICILIGDPDFASSLAEMGNRRILQYCSPTRVGNELTTFYTSIFERVNLL